MAYIVQAMQSKEAIQISKWKYEEPYSVYSMTTGQALIDEFLDGSYYTIKNENQELIGYFCFGANAQIPEGNNFDIYCEEGLVDLGLGMNPDFTGQGHGVEFLEKILEFTKGKFSSNKIRLSVASFNKRAIKLYENVGFEKTDAFEVNRENNKIEFITMIYKAHRN